MLSWSKPVFGALVTLNSVVQCHVVSKLMHLDLIGRNFKYGAQNISSGISLYLFVLCLWYLIHATGRKSADKQTVFHITDTEAKFNYVTVNRSL